MSSLKRTRRCDLSDRYEFSGGYVLEFIPPDESELFPGKWELVVRGPNSRRVVAYRDFESLRPSRQEIVKWVGESIGKKLSDEERKPFLNFMGSLAHDYGEKVIRQPKSNP